MEKRLFTFLLTEVLLLTVFNGLFGPWVQPLLWLTVAVIPGILLLAGKFYIPDFKRNKDRSTILVFIFTLIGGIIMTWFFSQKFLLEAKYSDIIPTIQLFIKRLFKGEPVYTLITEFGYDLPPTYLPGHWMPFIPSELLHIDPRIWAFLLGSIAWLPMILTAGSTHLNGKISASLPSLLFICWLLALPSEIGYSIEWLMAGYYVLFAWSLAKKNPWWIAFSLTFILLSRFSLILWIPVVLPLFFMQEWRKTMLIVSGFCAVAIVFIYIIPFLSKDWNALQNAQNYYSVAALKEWQGQSWQKPGDDAFQLSRGYGFAYWYYKLGTGSLPRKIAVYKNIQLIICIGSVFIMALWYYLKRNNKTDVRLFLLGSLKIYLALFYAFIQVPYPYLFMVPLAFGAALLYLVKEKELKSDF